MDEFSSPDFGELFEDFADFAATLPIATPLTSAFTPPQFPRLPAFQPLGFPSSFCPYQHPINRNPLDPLASTPSASGGRSNPFAPSSSTDPGGVGALRFGAFRSSHPAIELNRTPRPPHLPPLPLAYPQNGLPLPTQTFGFSDADSTSANSSRQRISHNGLPGPIATRLPEPDRQFFVNEFLTHDFSSPPAVLHRNPFDNLPAPIVAESSRAGAASSSSRNHNPDILSPRVKRERSQEPPACSATTDTMPRQSVKKEAGSSAAAAGQSGDRKRKRAASLGASSDVFGEGTDVKLVDLVDTEEVPDEIKAEEPKKEMVRLSGYNCVVCMDHVADMTSTHCGHVFCSGCLHGSLKTKKVCPVCRQKIDPRPPSGGKWSSRQKGHYIMNLKIGQKKTLGKKVEKK